MWQLAQHQNQWPSVRMESKRRGINFFFYIHKFIYLIFVNWFGSPHSLSHSHFMREIDTYTYIFLTMPCAGIVFKFILFVCFGLCCSMLCFVSLSSKMLCHWLNSEYGRFSENALEQKGNTPMSTKKDWFQIYIIYGASKSIMQTSYRIVPHFWMCMLYAYSRIGFMSGGVPFDLMCRDYCSIVSLQFLFLPLFVHIYVYILQWSNKQLFILYRWESHPDIVYTFDEDLSKETRFISTTNIMWLVATVFYFNTHQHTIHSMANDNDVTMKRLCNGKFTCFVHCLDHG